MFDDLENKHGHPGNNSWRADEQSWQAWAEEEDDTMPRTIDELLASVDAETPTGLENFWRDHNGLDFDGGPDQSFATFEEFLTNMLEEAAA